MREDIKEWYIHTRLLFNKISNSTLVKGADHNFYPGRWAHPHELRSLIGRHGEADSGLLLGIGSFGRPFRLKTSATKRELGNLAVVGRTRSGKGLCAKAQLLTWPHSAIVNDIKGDLFAHTSGYRSTFSDIYVFDTRGVGDRYNPLHRRVSEDDLLALAGYLLIEPHEGDGSVFTKRAVKMLAQLFKAARLENAAPLPYAAHLIHMGLADAAERLEALSQLHNMPPQKSLARRFLDASLETVDLDSRFLQDCFSTLDKLEPLMTETVLKSLSGSDFTGENVICGKRPVTVYLRWPEMHVKALTPLVRLVWSSLFDDMVSVYDDHDNKGQHGGRGCRPVLALLDEAGRAPVANLPELSSTVAGRKISLWIAYQSRSQPEAIYGMKRADELWDNIDSIVYYRPAIGNYKSAAQMQEALGFTSAYAKSHTTNAEHEMSEGESEQKIPLLVASEIQRMKDDRIVVGHADIGYFRADRVSYLEFPILKARKLMNPPPVLPLPEVEEIPALTQDVAATPDFIDPDRREVALRGPSGLTFTAERD